MLRNKNVSYGKNDNLSNILDDYPDAVAVVKGKSEFSGINGIVRFYETDKGVLVATEVMGLPVEENSCKKPVFGFHIHSGSMCNGNNSDPFANVGSHYNPNNCEHPYHAGDMPPLFGNNGFAVSVFLTDRITIEEIIGKTVIIHGGIDDFSTQPAGNAGIKIACGEIRKV